MGLRRYGFWKEVQNLTIYRNPDPSKGRWTRLVLPADYANGKLAGWNQRHAKDQSSTQFGCNPWGRSDFLAGDALLYGVGYIEVLDPQATLHPIGDYSSEDSFLWDSWVKSSMCNWSHDKQNQRFGFEFILDNEAEENAASVVYDDDEAIWSPYQAGSGSFSVSLSEETSIVKKGSSSLKASISSGSYSDVGASASFSPAQNWRGKDFLCLWLYGMGSGGTWRVQIGDGVNWCRWSFSDDFSGWRRVILPLKAPSESSGSVNLDAVSNLSVYITAASTGAWYLDRVAVDELRLVRCEVRVPDEIRSVDLYSWDGSSYQKFLENGLPSSNKLFFLSGLKMSDVRGDGSGLGSTYLGSRGEQVKYRNALSFDGVDDYVNTPLSINGYAGLTYEAWVNAGDLNFGGTSWKMIIDDGNNQTFLAVIKTNYQITFAVNTSSRSTLNSSLTLSQNQWYHIVGTYDGSYQKIYVNGVLNTSKAWSGNIVSSTTVRVGWGLSDRYWRGLIDEVRIYSRALSASEIQQLYLRRFDETIPDVRSGLVLDLPLDGDALDYSGYGNHGTIYGAKWVAPTSTQLSGKHGCRKRIVFVLGMPPEDYRDSASGGVSQAKIKLEVKYANDGEATYEFEDSDNQYYGLRNISKKYLLLFRKDSQGPVDFIQLKNTSVGDGLPTYLAVKADHSEEIKEVQITLPSLADQSRKHWGQSTSDPTQDQDGDGILDAVEEVEGFVDQGGWG
ncbi:MAG: hypothetical protein HA494_08205 [Thaumarchaeota archaeon]|nr:hypothetical protein [Nitrososphaerota archaeon]